MMHEVCDANMFTAIAFIFSCSFFRDLPNMLPNIAEQVINETNQATKERGINSLTPEQIELLKKQICHVLDGENSVYRLISRYLQIQVGL